jgi:hypothetical protein
MRPAGSNQAQGAKQKHEKTRAQGPEQRHLIASIGSKRPKRVAYSAEYEQTTERAIQNFHGDLKG